MPFTIIHSDITKLNVHAIVNAANTGLVRGGGVCGAIFEAAGAVKLQAACARLAPIKTGEAVITPGFDLPAKYVIHAAGPVYNGGTHGEEALLRSCYINALKRAVENGCESIAFPLISSGIYGYPKEEALRVATGAIRDFLADHDLNVSLVVFDKAAVAASEDVFGGAENVIDER
jgi:O-acetyl-ADP-ribose deacetylase (regulator of RNase III)